ncbi:MAG: hypothetical protein ASARMPRED_006358 [Alectoria sarmentosa]|nr:MAG: hypothetical protein ASARMPRED_006358 [Alectoria sarmentosa]
MTDQTSASSSERMYGSQEPLESPRQCTSRWSIAIPRIRAIEIINGQARGRNFLIGQDASINKKPRPPANRFWNFRMSHTWWGLEALASVISFGTFAGLVAVWASSEGHPPEVFTHSFGDPDTSWLADQVSLNGLVAFVATIIRVALTATLAAALSQGKWVWLSQSSRKSGHSPKLGDLETFDQGSRGQWGSLKFLWKMKCKNLACIGTLLTILTLGFDVFSQQIIGLGDRLVPDATAIASVPRTEFYSSGSIGTHTSWYPDPAMKASIKTGIMMENVPDLTVSCSTGNHQLDGSPAGIEFKNIPPELNVLPGTTCGISQWALRGIQDMNKFINNIAVSMTNGLRTQAPADKATHGYYAGTAYSM